jgi:hypothetical protein
LAQPAKPFTIRNHLDGPRPEDRSQGLFATADSQQHRFRNWTPLSVTWIPAEMSYQPLYFEDVPLERYGQESGLIQPVVSGARFYFNLISLPYQMGVDHVHDRVYSLGYYRPGSATPPLHQQLPVEADATALQVLTVLGLAFILP